MSQGSVRIKTEVAIPGGAILPVDVVTRNNVLQGHVFLRLQHAETFVQPYVDGLFGFNRFWTTTEVTVFEDTEVNTSRGLDDWTASYGLGGGLMFEVYRTTAPSEEDGEEFDVSICVDLGIRYLIGGKADYAKIKTLDQDGNFDTTSSRTDMVTAHVGVSFLF